MATVDATAETSATIRTVTIASREDEETTEIKIAMEIASEIAGATIDTIVTAGTVAEEAIEAAIPTRSDEQARACRSYRLKVCAFFRIVRWTDNYLFVNILERDAGRPKLNLAPRTVKDPVNALASTKQAAAIFGEAKPREEKVKDEEEEAAAAAAAGVKVES